MKLTESFVYFATIANILHIVCQGDSLLEYFRLERMSQPMPNISVRNFWHYGNYLSLSPDVYLPPKYFESCLTVLDNFRDTNILNANLPVVIRKSEMIASIHIFTGNYFKTDTWALAASVPLNTTILKNSTINCSLSSLFVGKNSEKVNVNALCLQLHATQYVSRTKPWRCQIHISIYPPLEVLDGYATLLYPPKLINFDSHMGNDPGQYPSVPLINVLIINKDNNPGVENISSGVRQWVLNTIHFWHKLTHEYFIVFLSSRDQIKYDSKIKREPTTTLVVCPHRGFDDNWTTAISEVKKLPSDKGSLQNLCSSKENFNWHFTVDDDEETSFFQKIFRILAKCETNLTNLHGGKLSPAENSAVELARVLPSVMNNFTLILLDSSQKYCKSQNIRWVDRFAEFKIGLDYKPFPVGYYYSQFAMRDPTSKLRFVSCGQRAMSRIPFEELTNVFGTFVWLSTIASIFVTSIFLVVFSKSKENSIAHFFSTLKVLLEQGDPFSQNTISRACMKFFLIIFLLAGIVLSTGYKNTNVYNMIVPRIPIPFEKFQQLTEHNFTVYSRSMEINAYKFLFYDTFSCPSSHFVHSKVIRNHRFCVMSEVEFNIATIQELDDIQWSANLIEKIVNESTLVKSEIRNRSQLHPSFLSYLQGTFEASSKKLRELELSYLLKDLIDCRRTALILPESKCEEYAKILRTINVPNVYVGKEVYLDLEWHFTLQGVVPPDVIWRWKGVQLGGILDKWMKLVSVSGHTKNEKNKNHGRGFPPQAAKMDGNVIVIFVVWLGGLCISVLEILWELVQLNLSRGGFCNYGVI